MITNDMRPATLGAERRRIFLLLLAVFLAAFLARAGFGVVRLVRSTEATALEFPDEHQYWHIAASMARGEGMRDELGFRAGRMPLYPAYLSLFANSSHGVVTAKALQWIVGALAAPVIVLLGLHLSGRRVALLAGLAVAFDPFLVFFSSLLLTETFAITGLCVFWLLVSRIVFSREHKTPEILARWLYAGLVGSLCVYLRESNLGLIVVSFLFVIAVTRFRPSQLVGGALSLLLVIASLVPWAVRNRTVVGEWVWLTTRAGISLYDGVGPQATGASDIGDVQRSGAAGQLPEREWNEHFRREAWKQIKNDPGRVVRLAGHKLARMWNPFPNVESYRGGATRWISALWTAPLFLLAIAGIVRCIRLPGRTGWVLVFFLLLPAIYFSLVHALYIGSVRYRLPAMPMIAVLAAMAFSAGTHRSTAPNDNR